MIDPHTNYSPDWQTPPEWWAWVNDTLGGLVSDAAPTHPMQDSLQCSWWPTTYCNPPGSNSNKSVSEWWLKAQYEIAIGNVERLVWCFFNNEHTRHLCPSPWELPGWMVMPVKRVAFFRGGRVIKSPRNWTWFWVSQDAGIPPEPPVKSIIVRTGA